MKDAIVCEEKEICLELLQKPSLLDVKLVFNTADALRLQVKRNNGLQ